MRPVRTHGGRRWRPLVVMAAIAMVAASATSAPYSVALMLGSESYGHVWTDPAGRWAVVERRQRYDSAGDYGLGPFTDRQLSKLIRIDLAGGAPAAPLFDQDPAAGYWAEGVSPSGRYLSVTKLAARRLRAGIVDMATGLPRWFDFTPDLPFSAPGPLWLDDRRLLYVALPAERLPLLLDHDIAAEDRRIRGWSDQAGGRIASVDRLASRSEDDDGQTPRTLVRIDLAGRPPRALLTGAIADLALSADRRFVAVILTAELQPPRPGPIGLAVQPRRRRLLVLDLATDRSWEPCPTCDVAPNLLRWSPTGARLLVFARDRADRPWRSGGLLAIDAVHQRLGSLNPSGPAPALDETAGPLLVRASWAGATAVMRGHVGDRDDWFALAPGRPSRPLTRGFTAPPAELVATSTDAIDLRDGDRLWRVALDGHRRLLADKISAIGPDTLDPYHFGTRGIANSPPFALPPLVAAPDDRPKPPLAKGPNLPTVRLPSGTRLLGYAATTHTAVLLAPTPSGTASLIVRKPDGSERTVDRINRALADITPAPAIAIPARAPNGSPVTHWLLLPEREDGGKPPLVVLPYPGQSFAADKPPQSGLGRVQAEVNPQLLVAHGYAVLLPSLPLATDAREPMAAIVAVIGTATDAVIATGRIDPSRIALWGHSYGGYAALAAATGPRRFAAIIASAAPGDLAALHGALDPRADGDAAHLFLSTQGWAEAGQGRMGGPPWRDPARYARNSPIMQLDAIDTPLLLIHGDLDVIPIEQAERMFAALYRAGKDVELLRYAGEAHMLSSPANIADMWTRLFDWLDRRLGSGPLPQPRLDAGIE